ncbi:hypothetical protein AAFF_G00200660 [Aldrovandia affinis]|uniref:Fumarylacetoacetase n=1 Tax=Aldrovandia affinis TaxID=143900 RepID=A0AAD7R2B2_9TELE|nr:hypothetical protein AAFF_G00200660 [Aldrovandia affinis]
MGEPRRWWCLGHQSEGPWAKRDPDPAQPPVFGPCKQLDIRVGDGLFVGAGNKLGELIPRAGARARLGMVLMNDWSSRWAEPLNWPESGAPMVLAARGNRETKAVLLT